MALHLNLYHEIQDQARARRRDPLKLGIYAFVFIGLCFVGYYLLRMKQVSGVVAQLQAAEAQWAQLEPRAAEAVERASALERSIESSKNLVAHVEDRFHWAPILEILGRIVPPSVQVTKFAGDLRAAEQAQITLDGISAGMQPRTLAEDLRIHLGETLSAKYEGASATFVSLDDGTETVHVDGDAVPTAVFTVRADFDPTKPAPPVEEAPPALRGAEITTTTTP